MGNSWPGPSCGYYLWSSFKAMELIRQSGIAPAAGNIGPNDLGTLPAASAPACVVRQVNKDPAARGAAGRVRCGCASATTPASPSGQYFDYAHQILSMQCADGGFIRHRLLRAHWDTLHRTSRTCCWCCSVPRAAAASTPTATASATPRTTARPTRIPARKTRTATAWAMPATTARPSRTPTRRTATRTASATPAKSAKCDLDSDGDIDSADIRASVDDVYRPDGAAGTRAADPDNNKFINVNDSRRCTLICTRPSCARNSGSRSPVGVEASPPHRSRGDHGRHLKNQRSTGIAEDNDNETATSSRSLDSPASARWRCVAPAGERADGQHRACGQHGRHRRVGHGRRCIAAYDIDVLFSNSLTPVRTAGPDLHALLGDFACGRRRQYSTIRPAASSSLYFVSCESDAGRLTCRSAPATSAAPTSRWLGDPFRQRRPCRIARLRASCIWSACQRREVRATTRSATRKTTCRSRARWPCSASACWAWPSGASSRGLTSRGRRARSCTAARTDPNDAQSARQQGWPARATLFSGRSLLGDLHRNRAGRAACMRTCCRAGAMRTRRLPTRRRALPSAANTWASSNCLQANRC